MGKSSELISLGGVVGNTLGDRNSDETVLCDIFFLNLPFNCAHHSNPYVILPIKVHSLMNEEM